VASNGITLILCFVKIGQLIRRLKGGTDRHTFIHITESVGIAMGYELDDRGSISGRVKIFLFPTESRLAAGRVADHSPPSSAEVKNGGAIPPLPHMSSWHSA
jgi:hypothetical protein